MEETIYVQLLNEGVQVSRPVKAIKISDGLYKLTRPEDYDPEDEEWEFLPESIVRCKWVRGSVGEHWLAFEELKELL